MDSKTLGNTAQLVFGQFGNRPIEGKVDTGATVSSLHAEKIKTNGGQVSFSCPSLSDNVITLDMDSSQEVRSADGGGVTRPVVVLDVEVNGVPMKSVKFNLNDRSGMDSPILIGQNILQPGGFIIDPNAGSDEQQPDEQQAPASMTREHAILQAVEVLVEHDVSLPEIIKYLQTIAVNNLED